MWHLYSNDNDDVQAAAGVGSHFITNNLLQFGFILLFIRSHFFWAELLLIINFFNLTLLYFRHNTHSKHLIHMPVVSGPLAWTFLALYWNGAIAVNAHSLPARILANVAIWGVLVYGWFFLIVYKVSGIFGIRDWVLTLTIRTILWDLHLVYCAHLSALASF